MKIVKIGTSTCSHDPCCASIAKKKLNLDNNKSLKICFHYIMSSNIQKKNEIHFLNLVMGI